MTRLTSALGRYLPPSLRSLFRNSWYLLGDVANRLRGADELTPLVSRSLVGFGDFKRIGKIFEHYLVVLGHLEPQHKMLDVGCGIGRIAVPLTGYLAAPGEYWGLDVSRRGIDWCVRKITPRHPSFHFLWCDVYSKEYNPAGSCRARDYRFPFETGTFDFVCAISLFTHMLRPDLERYVAEAARVTKPGGRLFATFFLLNDEARSLATDGGEGLLFPHEVEGTWVAETRTPEAAAAHDEADVRGLLASCGFRIEEPVHYGAWCGRPSFVSYQDMIVAVRE